MVFLILVGNQSQLMGLFAAVFAVNEVWPLDGDPEKYPLVLSRLFAHQIDRLYISNHRFQNDFPPFMVRLSLSNPSNRAFSRKNSISGRDDTKVMASKISTRFSCTYAISPK